MAIVASGTRSMSAATTAGMGVWSDACTAATVLHKTDRLEQK